MKSEFSMQGEPKLVVRLKTDEAGKPVVEPGSPSNHYGVVFEVQDAPADAFVATFELDPSYYDASRAVRPSAEGIFRLETMTYGDYPLTVRLFRPSGVDVILRDKVAQALRREYASDAVSPVIAQAISEIAAH